MYPRCLIGECKAIMKNPKWTKS